MSVSDFIDYCESNNVDKVTDYLARGAENDVVFHGLYFALGSGCSEVVDILLKVPNIDYNLLAAGYDDTLGHASVQPPASCEKCVKALAAKETYTLWNVHDSYGNTPLMDAVKRNWSEAVEILLQCPRVRVDLGDRDRQGWSLVFRAIQWGNLGK